MECGQLTQIQNQANSLTRLPCEQLVTSLFPEGSGEPTVIKQEHKDQMENLTNSVIGRS